MNNQSSNSPPNEGKTLVLDLSLSDHDDQSEFINNNNASSKQDLEFADSEKDGNSSAAVGSKTSSLSQIKAIIHKNYKLQSKQTGKNICQVSPNSIIE